MADDMTFSRNVPDVKGTPEVKTIQRSVKAQETPTPEFQSSFQKYAESQNHLSAIGASVAQNASNAMAAKLGYEEGKNPHGELTPSFTEFDKTFEANYSAQAHATLNLQANKLLTDTQIQMAQSNRLTPELIAKTNNQLQTGLSKIAQQAPLQIRSQLEDSFNSQILSHTTQYKERMIREQRQDQTDNLKNGIDLSSKNSYEMGTQGNQKASLASRDAAIKSADIAYASRYISAEEARVAKETAQQLYINGRSIHEATRAYNNGVYPAYIKAFSENKQGMTDEQHMTAGKAVVQQINFLQSMKSQDENLKAQQMLNQIALAPQNITDTDWTSFQNSVSAIKAKQVEFHYIQALKKHQENTISNDALSKNWSDATVWANTTEKTQNQAFNEKVNYAVQNSHKTTIPLRSNPLSRDDAEVMVASGAGGQIPVFTKTLKNKLQSSNPAVVESAMQQIHSLQQNGNGQALKGLSDQDWSMFSAAQSLRDSPDPLKANQDAHNRIYNQDPEVEKLNNQKWANTLIKQNSANVPNDVFALSQFGMSKEDFINPTIASAYGINILSKYSNFFSISGNLNEAKISTQRWVDENYGDTFINGGKHTTLNPIEKYIGFTSRDGVPYIQQDIVSQFNEKMLSLKPEYDQKKTNEYWEAIPVLATKHNMNNPFNIKSDSSEAQKAFEIPDLTKVKEQGVKTAIQIGEAGIGGVPIGTMIHTGLSRDKKDYTAPTEIPSQEHGAFFKTYDPIKVKRHTRTSNGEKVDTFNIILIGNSFGNYDVAIETKSGMRNLFREAPHLGIMAITPRKQSIIDAYNKDHNLK